MGSSISGGQAHQAHPSYYGLNQTIDYGALFKDSGEPFLFNYQSSMERSTSRPLQDDQEDRLVFDLPFFPIGEILPTPISTSHDHHQPHTFRCQWSECLAILPTMESLANHVNSTHLLPPSTQYQTKPSANPSYDQQQVNLACLWADCNAQELNLFANSGDGYAASRADEQLRYALAAHMMHDHLGLNLPQPHPAYLSPTSGNSSGSSSTAVDHHSETPSPFLEQTPSADERPTPTAMPSPPESVAESSAMALARTKFSPLASTRDAHPCKWVGCDRIFTNAEDLTTHLTEVHVGAGKNAYECGWEGCARSGARSFSSKQKISRHLQSHTGHRPFRCEQCDQMFSEAATLQQHMRRHTQESALTSNCAN